MTKEKLPHTLKKPSGCIHVEHTLSGPSQRLYNCILAYVQDDISDIEGIPIFQVPTEIVRGYMHTRNDSKIKEWLMEMRRKDVEFNNIGKGGVSWGCYGFINDPEMIGSYIRFSIAPTLRQLMVDSTMFAKINMLVERKFKKTKHALPLYELGLDYRDHKDPIYGAKKGVTPWFELEDFRKYMGIIPGEFTAFKKLNQQVIQKGLKEIKAESDIVMKLDKETEKRVVKRIRFIIEDNTANMSPVERLKRIQATLPGADSLGIEVSKLSEFLMQVFDIHKPRARKIAKLYAGNESYFKEIAEKVNNKKLAGECKGKIAPFAAKIFEDENPMVELNTSEES
ncbi:MAG: replication initiation protein [Spirochaetales bacterium]|nr:replication initiation protein [Spirochaetales bacterium]